MTHLFGGELGPAVERTTAVVVVTKEPPPFIFLLSRLRSLADRPGIPESSSLELSTGESRAIGDEPRVPGSILTDREVVEVPTDVFGPL